MDKELIPKKQYDFLKDELEKHTQTNVLTSEQVNTILQSYQVQSGLSFIKVLLMIGSTLIGLGILSFVASNWDYMSNLSRVLLILGVYLGVNHFSFKFATTSPKLSQALLYLSTFVFGAGIFLMGQIFNFGGHFTMAFLLWGIGIFPMAVIFKDKIIYLFTHILIFVFLNGHFDLNSFPYFVVAIIPLLYYFNGLFDYWKLGTFFNNLLLINFLVYLGYWFKLEALYVVLGLFILGLIMAFKPFAFNQRIFVIQGQLLLGITGLILTFSGVWEGPFSAFYSWNELPHWPSTLALIFTFLFLILLFFMVKGNSIIALLFICVTIFRYYVDTLFDFLPKSLFFITGGLILIGFGYYFDKLRKERGGFVNEFKQ